MARKKTKLGYSRRNISIGMDIDIQSSYSTSILNTNTSSNIYSISMSVFARPTRKKSFMTLRTTKYSVMIFDKFKRESEIQREDRPSDIVIKKDIRVCCD